LKVTPDRMTTRWCWWPACAICSGGLSNTAAATASRFQTFRYTRQHGRHTFALILALSRKVIQSHNRARAGDFSPTGLQGFDLRGKTLGVVGTGHIAGTNPAHDDPEHSGFRGGQTYEPCCLKPLP
jgi:D-isomer specific 2-hydroxyacid dehydrogenase, NAD binding domain